MIRFLLIVLLILVAISAMPVDVQAQGFVPCASQPRGCLLNDIDRVASIILYWIIGIAVTVAAIMFAYAGVLYLSAGGSSEQLSKAHGIFKNVFIGLILVLAAWLMIDLLIDVLSGGEYDIETIVDWINNDLST